MRIWIPTLLGAGCMLLAAGASAEEYSVVEGHFTETATGESVVLSGRLEIEDSGTPLSDDSVVYSIDDFELQAGDRAFAPGSSVEHDGQVPVGFLQLADQIHITSDGVRLFHVRSGGEFVEATDDQVTFRYFDFESTDASESRVSGPLPDRELPRRFHLQGRLYQVDQTFFIRDGACPPGSELPPIVPAPPGGGVIIIGGGIDGVGGGLLHSFESFDLSPDNTTTFISPTVVPNIITRVTGDGGSLIGGVIHSYPDADLLFINPDGITFGETLIVLSEHVLPTLEDLNIIAPDGAAITFDDVGLLTVTSDGVITLAGSFPEIPGLTGVRIVATGGIIVLGEFMLPSDVSLELTTDGSVEIPDRTVPPIIAPGCDVIVIGGLLPVRPAVKTELGSFSITASAATQVEIDVLPGRHANRLRLGSRQRVWVAVLGSEDFDVDDVDASSLRLGPAEAEPFSRRFGRTLSVILDINRGRGGHHLDLLTAFDVRKLGVAYGDTELCLYGQTHSGVAFEGCDRIDAMPKSLKRKSRRSRRGSHRGADHRRKR